MDLRAKYRSKLTTAEKVVKVVKNGDWIDYSFGLGQPVALDSALAGRKEELRDIKIRGVLRLTPSAVVNADPQGEVFTHNSWFFSGGERKMADKGLCCHIPMVYRNLPLFYRKSLEIDVAMLTVSPMDENGYFGFSLANSASKAIVEKAKVVIVEINDKLPKIFGKHEHLVHLDEIDYIVEGANPDLPVIPPAEPNETDKKIAAHILKEIVDGATIQLGIGSLPNEVGKIIAQSDLKDLGVHSEMLADAFMLMAKAGKITNKLKNIDKGLSIFSFCAGSKELYDWADGNLSLASAPVDYTNDPSIIALNDNVITINNCIEVDLYGQAASETAGYRQVSGTGGQLDFLVGGYMSKGGKSFICFSSTFTDKKTGCLKSRVLPILTEGSVVSAPRTQVHYLVTEWGCADLAGRSTWERAERIINIAHPDFREELVRSADKMNLWRRSNKI